ncbi:MAG TPA: penicillin-binding protein activator LpoB [Ohtaekwangia sp.]|nr:penicillin-binding protein activator LpoB [Ohtaekwangia sp.]
MHRIFPIFLIFLAGCSPTVNRISPDTQVDLSGRWNDSDSRMVADQMIYDLVNSESYKAYARDLGRKPVIIVGTIRNRTSEHIDASNYVKKLEVVIHNSGLAELVEGQEFRDQVRRERAEQQEFASAATMAQWGKETGADLMLFGEMSSETDTAVRKRVVNYVTTLFLTDLESNKRIWYGQREIKKLVKN